MKQFIFSLAALSALILTTSCNKEALNHPNTPADGTAIVKITALTEVETRATGIADNSTDTKKVGSLQVFAFDNKGVLKAYENTTSGSTVSMKLDIGREYSFYAVANNYGVSSWKYSSVAPITSLSALKSIMTDLKDNTPDNLLMFSQAGVKKTITSSVENIPIELTRLVSKIQIKKITVDFGSNDALKRKSFKIDSLFVINAAAKETFDLASETNVTYYNLGKFVTGNAYHLLLDKLSSAAEVSSATGVVTPYETVHTFFAYGNHTAKPTRLVISCNWGGERTYYPINITGADGYLSPNCAYVINQLTIKGMGSDNPDVIPERKNFTASVTIKDWATGFEKTVEL